MVDIFDVEDGFMSREVNFGWCAGLNSRPVLMKDLARPKNSSTVGLLFDLQLSSCCYFVLGVSNAKSSILVYLVPKKESATDGVAAD